MIFVNTHLLGTLCYAETFNARTASDPDFIQYDNDDEFIQNDSNYIYMI